MHKDNMLDVERVKEILLSSAHAVFFGGAGVSTDSGIPDFRGNGGLYASSGGSNEYYLSRECLECEPEKFFSFFRKNMIFENAHPNAAHVALANLEKRGIIKSVITQNIDGLHQKAGSRRVIELHGTVSRYYCVRCGKVYDEKAISEQIGIPHCDVCKALVRPDVTLYGEALDGFNYADAEQEISRADVLIVGGSSLVVNPAASLVGSFQGKHLIIINYSSTPYDNMAEYVIRESISDVFKFLEEI
jgi:NAD-dependent deacetylase